MQKESRIILGRRRTGLPKKTVTRKICGRGVTFMTFNLDLNEPSQRYIWECLDRTGWYEYDSVMALSEVLRGGDSFIDVGAHVGYFSVIASALVGPTGSVLAFEPIEENALAAKGNAPNATIIRGAVGEHSQSVTFYRNLDNDGGHSLWNPAAHSWNIDTQRSPVAETVYMYRLDDFLGRLPTAIKIDTEGAECGVLRGARRMLAQPQLKMVICELNEFGLAQMGDSEEVMRDIMQEHGFFGDESAPDIIGNIIFRRE